jgi:hypothetical protein
MSALVQRTVEPCWIVMLDGIKLKSVIRTSTRVGLDGAHVAVGVMVRVLVRVLVAVCVRVELLVGVPVAVRVSVKVAVPV